MGVEAHHGDARRSHTKVAAQAVVQALGLAHDEVLVEVVGHILQRHMPRDHPDTQRIRSQDHEHVFNTCHVR